MRNDNNNGLYIFKVFVRSLVTRLNATVHVKTVPG